MGGNTTPQRQATISAFFRPIASPIKHSSSESPNSENNRQVSSPPSSSSSPSTTSSRTTTRRGAAPSASAAKRGAAVGSSTPAKRQQPSRSSGNSVGGGARSSKKRALSPPADEDGDGEYRDDEDANDDEFPLLPRELHREEKKQDDPGDDDYAEEKEKEQTLASRRSQSGRTTATATEKPRSSSSSLTSKFAFKKNTATLSPTNGDAATPQGETAAAAAAEVTSQVEDGTAPTAAPIEMDEEKAARRAKFLDKLGNFRASTAIPLKEGGPDNDKIGDTEKTALEGDKKEEEEEEEAEDGDSSFVMAAKSGAKRRRLVISDSEGEEGDDDDDGGGSDYTAEDDYGFGEGTHRKKAAATTAATKKSMASTGGSSKKKMAPATTAAIATTPTTTAAKAGQDAWKTVMLGGGGAGSSSSNPRGKKDKSPFTPLEKQFIEIKQQYPDAILCIEVGYKFKFFGEDAQIASKELSIAHFMDHNFYTASIPVHRLDVHVRRLVHAGYKVGVVRQMETAALKSVGDNKSAPFTRELTNLYTKATFLESLEQDMADPASSSSHYIACIVEELQGGMGTDERVRCSILAVQPATGDVVYDEFQDMYMRSELETRLLHLQPAELILPEKGLSPATENLVKHLSMPHTRVMTASATATGGMRTNEVRTERSRAFHKYSKAFSLVSEFYSTHLKEEQQRSGGGGSSSTEDRLAGLMTTVLTLPQNVIVALWAMIDHLMAFGLTHVLMQTKYFQPFHTLSHMMLTGNTLNNLEIFRNQTDGSVKGSLLEILDRTKTGFGRRLLKKWVGKPLVDRRRLQQRVDAVEEILAKHGGAGGAGSSEALAKVEKCLTGLMDLEKGVCRIHYGYASPKECWLVLKTFERIHQLFPKRLQSGGGGGGEGRVPSDDLGLDSPYLNELLASLTVASGSVLYFLNALNEQAAKQNDKIRLLDRDVAATKWPEILQHEAAIQETEEQLRLCLKDIAKLMREPRLDFTSVSGIDYLIEVKNKDMPKVPKSWVKISGTKQVSRFHTPETTKLIHAKAQHQERLTLRCNEAFKEFCKEFSGQYEVFRDVVQALATLDCLFSLAAVARRPGYCKAEYVDAEDDVTENGGGASTVIEIKKGRHPMVEQLLQGSAGTDFVPNDVDFGKRTIARAHSGSFSKEEKKKEKAEEGKEEQELDQVGTMAAEERRDKWDSDEQKTMILTGPNMGGKSCYIRQVALLCLMAQIGSYVPAERARLSLLDGIYTRMGASDNLFGNESTFMVELQETSEILRRATPRSLIILDELGRGTSTLDGVAIAYAVLKYCVTEIRATTLFVTHYPSLAEVANEFPKGRVRNYHMGFMATKTVDVAASATATATTSESASTPSSTQSKTWIDSTSDDAEVSEHDEIVFLYNLVEGVSLKSYGLNVARLAKLPPSLIARAKEKSKELEILLEQRRQKRRLGSSTQDLQSSSGGDAPRGKKRPRDDTVAEQGEEEEENAGTSLSDQSARQQQSIEMLHLIWTCQTPEQAQKVFDLCR
ncbi:Mismatch repair protein msh3 [Actinomortierella ambigua]|nr:Mismatch repair protein msh3 [Actinomortierella ambigua]